MRKMIQAHPALVAVVASLLIAGSAFAYYLATGSGEVRTHASGATPHVTLSGAVQSEVGPGDSTGVSLQVTNETGTKQFVGNVLGTVEVVGAPGCDPSWFHFEGVTEGVEVPEGTTDLPHDAHLTFTNEPTNQSACKGAELVINLTS